MSCERPNPLLCHFDILRNDISLDINLTDGLLISRTQWISYLLDTGVLIRKGIERALV
jgi:hypothetical protein